MEVKSTHIVLVAMLFVGCTAAQLDSEKAIQVNINWYVEKLIRNLQTVLSNNFEPLHLPPYDLTIKYQLGLIVFLAQLRLDNCTLSNLSTIYRPTAHNSSMVWDNEILHFFTELSFQNLTLDANYTVRAINIGKVGEVTAVVKGASVKLAIDCNFNNATIRLKDLKLISKGGIDVDLKGNFLDTIGTAIIQAIATLFQRIIFSSIGHTLKKEIENILELIEL